MELVRELLTIQEEDQVEQPQEEQDEEGEQEEQEEEHMAEQLEEEEEQMIEVLGEPEYIAFVPPAPRLDPISRLVRGFKVHELDVLPATSNKLFPTRVC